MVDLKNSVFDRVRVLDSSSADITDDLGVIISSGVGSNKNQEVVGGVNTDVFNAYISEGEIENTGSLNVEAADFKPLELFMVEDTPGGDLVVPRVLPEFTFKAQATTSEHFVVDKFKFGECVVNAAVGGVLTFEFSGRGTGARVEDGLLSLTERNALKIPVIAEKVKVLVDDAEFELVQDLSLTLSRELQGTNGIGSGSKESSHVDEGKVNITLDTFSAKVKDDKAWRLFMRGKESSAAALPYGHKVTRGVSEIKIELESGDALVVGGALFGEVSPDDMDGSDGDRLVNITGDAVTVSLVRGA